MRTGNATALKRFFLGWIGSFRYFWTYLKGATKQWMNILFGESILGVLMILLWQYAPWFPFGACFVIATVVAGFFLWYEAYSKSIPKFEISECITQPRRMNDEQGRPAEGIFVQLIPKCLTQAQVLECKATLIAVYKKQQSKWEPTRINEASRLNWSISGSAEITLEPGAEARLNVCHSQSNSDQLIHDSDWKVIDAIDDLKVPGKYSFDVKVTGKDCAPAYVSVEVGFASTQWDGIECRLHPYLTKDRSDFG